MKKLFDWLTVPHGMPEPLQPEREVTFTAPQPDERQHRLDVVKRLNSIGAQFAQSRAHKQTSEVAEIVLTQLASRLFAPDFSPFEFHEQVHQIAREKRQAHWDKQPKAV